MKNKQNAIFIGLLALVLLALAAAFFTRDWANYRDRLRALRAKGNQASTVVDTHALDSAQQVAALAVTHTEHDYAQQALRLADHSVDLAFAAALRDASENPVPLTPETRALQARITASQASVAADKDRVADLTKQVAKARRKKKDALQEQLDLVKAQAELDQDDLDDAKQAFIAAGGDRHATIEKLREQHEASQAHAAAAGNASQANAAESPESTESHSFFAEFKALMSMRAKDKLLVQSQQNAQARQAARTSEYAELEKEIANDKAQKKIIRKHSAAARPSASSTPAFEAGLATKGAPPPAPANTVEANPAVPASSAEEPASQVSFFRELAQSQVALGEVGKRIEVERELASTYGNWIAFVRVREQAFLHEIFVAIFWILLIGLLVLAANQLIHRFFADLKPEARQLHTVRAAVLVSVQALGVVLILLVVFGPPSQLGTILALAGAGLTVAMKDFIVGFVGWFVLMGENGIRQGDWVEINGVGGEVLQVGLLHTVLLETGNWSDAAHPTGRKVTFTNSFAIEGHYFNFSTSGQWLWDELQVLVPETGDPYRIAEGVRKIATAETAENARQAEEEWNRVVPAQARQAFSAAPSISVRPGVGGVNVLVRYLTRARDRQQVRGHLYQSVVELLHGRDLPESVTVKPAPTQRRAAESA